MKKSTIKKMAAWALTAALLISESGVVSAAETVSVSGNDGLLTEFVLESGEDFTEESLFPEETSAETGEAAADEEASVESEVSEEAERASEEPSVGDEASSESETSEESDEASSEETSDESVEPSEEEPSESVEPSEEEPSESVEPSVEEPSESESASEEVFEDFSGESEAAALGDTNLKACGSDGILYSGVSYLSAATVLGFDADTREAYLELCDEIAQWKQNGDAVSDIVLFTDTNGDLGFSYFITNESFSVGGVPKASEDIIDEEKNDESKNVTGITILRETDAQDVLADAEDGQKVAAAAENLSLADSVAIEEETFALDEVEQESFNTLYSNEDYFRGQLTSVERKIYDAAKAKMVKGGSNSFSFKNKDNPSSANICNALSAIQDTYPSSFEWVERGSGGASTKGYFRGGTWELTTTVKKSKHYSASLLSSAKKKVKTLVTEAYAYAEKSYPNNPTYGIIKYFDSWICENNYYNNIGLGSTQKDLASKEFYYCHSSVGILLKGYGVCESYALAMNRLLDEAGIPAMVVYGTGNGGGHAWNYVQMPNGSWYLLDSTWNDSGASSSGGYLLTAADTQHVATGARYTVGKSFSHPTLASSKYTTSSSETFFLNKTSVVLTKGKKEQLSLTSTYYSRFKGTYASSDTKVAKVDAKGKITAVAPGKATISYKIAGAQKTCTVYVYQLEALQFTSNQKSTCTMSYSNKKTEFDGTELLSVSIYVKQKNATLSASTLRGSAGLDAPKTTVGNAKVATISSCTMLNDTITLNIRPLKLGSTKITVSFGGKKATLNLKVTYGLQDEWFNTLPVTSTEYTGKAIKPKVTASASMPKGVTYKVSYKNNKNAGTATVVITGTGNYSGTIEKTFQIKARDFTKAEFVSCTASRTYTGKQNPAATVVKYGGKKLKAGVDYVVYYEYNGNSTIAPIGAAAYTVKVVGKGNYSGTLAKTFTYTIQKAPITKMKVTCPSTVKYNNGAAVTPTVTVKIGAVTVDDYNYTLQWQNAEGTVVTSLTAKGKYTLTITPKGNFAATDKKKVITKTVTVK